MTNEEKFTNRKIVLSGDGSHTLLLPILNETYHSRHGAITESLYVFIEKGLHANTSKSIKIFEVGFGTGLNAWLSLNEANGKKIQYYSIEAFPLERKEFEAINYSRLKEYPLGDVNYLKLHESPWSEKVRVNDSFELYKIHSKLENFIPKTHDFDLIYYDAYGPSYQSEMWQEQHFKKMYDMLIVGGKLVSYCCSGVFKRALKASGFSIEKLPGPPGKREMIVATK